MRAEKNRRRAAGRRHGERYGSVPDRQARLRAIRTEYWWISRIRPLMSLSGMVESSHLQGEVKVRHAGPSMPQDKLRQYQFESVAPGRHMGWTPVFTGVTIRGMTETESPSDKFRTLGLESRSFSQVSPSRRQSIQAFATWSLSARSLLFGRKLKSATSEEEISRDDFSVSLELAMNSCIASSDTTPVSE